MVMDGVRGGVMYTLNSTEVHAVSYKVYDARGNGEGGCRPQSLATIRIG